MTFLLPPFAGGFQFAVASGQNLLVPSVQFVVRRDVTDGRMQPNRVVVFDELGHDPSSVFQGQGGSRTDALFLEDAMPAFDLAIALRVIRRGPCVRHAADTDKLLEIPGDKLRAVVGDDSRRHAGELLPRPLDDLLDIGLGHRLPQLPMHEEAAATIQEAAQVVEGAGDIDVGDINMPVLVRQKRLNKALALAGGLGRMAIEQAGLVEDTVDAGRTARGDVLVKHHEGQAAIALQRKQSVEVADSLLLLLFEPVVARNPGIMLIGLAVAALPGVPLGGGQAQPEQEASDGNAGLVGPTLDEVNDLVAGVVGNPDAFQSSPSSFFSWTCSSMSSERTSCLRCSRASRSAILRSLASVSVLRRLSCAVKAAVPFSKKDFFDEVLSEQGDFLFGAEVATLLSHGYSSARVLPLTLTKANSCFDWGKTICNLFNSLGWIASERLRAYPDAALWGQERSYSPLLPLRAGVRTIYDRHSSISDATSAVHPV